MLDNLKSIHVSYMHILQRISIICLLLINACDCRNHNHTDKLPKHDTNIAAGIRMQVTPTTLVGEQKQVRVNFTIAGNVSVSEFANYRLKVTCTSAIPADLDNKICYMDTTGKQVTQADINEKLSHLVKDIPSIKHGGYTLSFTLIPDPKVAHLIINFKLVDNQNKLLLSDQAIWEDELPDLKVELQGNAKLFEDNRDFSLKITNRGAKEVLPDQLKLVVTRIDGNDASVGIDDANKQLQEIDIEEIKVGANTLKNFKIYPNTDKKAKFSFHLIYKGKELDPSASISWQESPLEIIELYYNREGSNQVYYQVFNHGSLEKDAVEIAYTNLSKNKVTLAGSTQQSAVLGNVRNLSCLYSSLYVSFNGENSAEFEFNLIEKGKIVGTRTIRVSRY